MTSVLMCMVRFLVAVAAFSVMVMCAACHTKQHITAQTSQVSDNFKLQFIRSCSPISGNPQVSYMLPDALQLLDSAPQLGTPSTQDANAPHSFSFMPMAHAWGNDTFTIIGTRQTAAQLADTSTTAATISVAASTDTHSCVFGSRPLLLLFVVSFCLNLLFVWILSKLGGKN